MPARPLRQLCLQLGPAACGLNPGAAGGLDGGAVVPRIAGCGVDLDPEMLGHRLDATVAPAAHERDDIGQPLAPYWTLVRAYERLIGARGTEIRDP